MLQEILRSARAAWRAGPRPNPTGELHESDDQIRCATQILRNIRTELHRADLRGANPRRAASIGTGHRANAKTIHTAWR